MAFVSSVDEFKKLLKSKWGGVRKTDDQPQNCSFSAESSLHEGVLRSV